MNIETIIMSSQKSPNAVISKGSGFVNFNGTILNKGMISEISDVYVLIPSDSVYKSGGKYPLSKLEKAVEFSKNVHVKYSVSMGNGTTYYKTVRCYVDENLEEGIQEVKEHYEKFIREL